MTITRSYCGAALLRCISLAAAVACTATVNADPVDNSDASPSLAETSIVVQGLHRKVRFYRPETTADAPALLIALHGSGGDGARFRMLTAGAFDRLADEHGFIVAYPDALGGQWNDCRARAAYREALRGIDDVAFVRSIAKNVEASMSRPLAGVFVVGYSNGGHMAFRLALEAPQDFTGFAAIAASLPAAGELACASQDRAVPMVVVAGTRDPINPWSGGEITVPGGATYGAVVSAEATAAHFRELAGLDDAPRIAVLPDRDPHDGTRVETHVWMAGERPAVMLLKVEGGGHSLPLPVEHFPVALVGPTSHDVDAAVLTWSFFANQVP